MPTWCHRNQSAKECNVRALHAQVDGTLRYGELLIPKCFDNITKLGKPMQFDEYFLVSHDLE